MSEIKEIKRDEKGKEEEATLNGLVKSLTPLDTEHITGVAQFNKKTQKNIMTVRVDLKKFKDLLKQVERWEKKPDSLILGIVKENADENFNDMTDYLFVTF